MNNMLLFVKFYKELVVFDRQLQKRGFHEMFLETINNFPYDLEKRQRLANMTPLVENVRQVLEVIDKVCVNYLKDAQCLHRSFLAFRYLRTEFGLPVHLVVGVRKFPFYAHAWLTIEGHPLNDRPEFVGQFSVMLNSEEEVAAR